MKISVFLFGLDLHDYTPLVQAAELSGFSAVWLGDHLISPEHPSSPNPYSSAGLVGFDPRTPLADIWAVLAHAAAATSRIQLGTGVYVLPLRNVLATARSAASIQALATGRLLFGIGTGWLREEFEAVHEPFDGRGARTDEMIEAMRLLWTGEPVAYSGRHLSFPEVRLAPPVQDPIPILGGGMSWQALDRAARYCNGWFGPACDLQSSIDARRYLQEARDRFQTSESFALYVRPNGAVDEEILDRYGNEGFDHITLSLTQMASGPLTSLADRIACITEAATRFGLPSPQ